MKYIESSPNITKHEFCFGPGDKMYGKCLWVRITLDHDTYTLFAEGDCGKFSYNWIPTKSESFFHLLSRLEKEYLIEKISSPCVLDLKESIRETIDQLRWIDEDLLPEGITVKQMKKDLREINASSEESFYREANRITCGKLCEGISISKRYPAGANNFCDIFCDYLQPILKRKTGDSSKDKIVLKGKSQEKPGMMSEALLEHNKKKLRGKDNQEKHDYTKLIIPAKKEEK